MLQIKKQNAADSHVLKMLRIYSSQKYLVLDDALCSGKRAIAIAEPNHLLHILSELGMCRMSESLRSSSEAQQYLWEQAMDYCRPEKFEKLEKLRKEISPDENIDEILFTKKITDAPEYPDLQKLKCCWNIGLLIEVCETYKIHYEVLNA